MRQSTDVPDLGVPPTLLIKQGTFLKVQGACLQERYLNLNLLKGTDAVAQLVVTFILNFSCSLVPQQRMLVEGNHENFTKARLEVLSPL
eukprot:4845126-Amphidinium_carterae.1